MSTQIASTQSDSELRHFIVWRYHGKLDRVVVFDDSAQAVREYEVAESVLGNGEECVLLGADRLATCIATHGNWFDEPCDLDEYIPTSESITREQVESLNSLLALKAVEGLSIATEDDVRLVYCTYCHKTHAAKLDEEPCAPGAWLDPTAIR